MFTDNNLYLSQLTDIIRSGNIQISTIKPSDWVEQNIVMKQPFPGPYRYSKTPYCREIIDRLAPDDPAKWVAWMKGLQIGASAGVIIPGLVWIIRNSPANTYFTVGAPDLVDKAVEKLDLGIDGSNSRSFIKPQTQRIKNNKSGDTNSKKDFVGGYIVITSANNHKNWRDVSLRYGFFDDFEAVKQASKESGDTRKLIEGRFAAYKDTHKIFYISTPELLESSNIRPAFLLGDQRHYHVECPCCHEPIIFKWSINEGDVMNGLKDEKALCSGGIHFEQDHRGKVVESSIGYICYKCGGFFTDQYKQKQLNGGFWVPTAEPSQMGYYSYHTPSLYAPAGMYDWRHYVHNWVEAHPQGQQRNEHLYKTFVNTCLGECYQNDAEAPKANIIQKNCREYKIGTIPEKLSIADGNGRIIMITCAADMNGKADDARLDYEIVAWSEKGASYSIKHGSIGTFVKGENKLKVKEDRVHWTYEFGRPNNVWDEFARIIDTTYYTDTGRQMKIMRTGLDSGYFATNYAYPFIERTPNVIGLKGKGEDDYFKYERLADHANFTPAKERGNLYILKTGYLKDDLANFMQLGWNQDDPMQPKGFMNFPQPENGLYTFNSYFEHFESEHCVMEAKKDGSGVICCWKKKNSNVANHMLDCRIYNMAVREIIVSIFAKELKQPKLTWSEFAAMFAAGIENSLRR